MGNVPLVEPDASLLRLPRILVSASCVRVGSHLVLMRGLALLVRGVLGLLLGLAETLPRAVGPLALKLGTLQGLGGPVSSPTDGIAGSGHRGAPDFGSSNSAQTR
jgi:hypothetical protein